MDGLIKILSKTLTSCESDCLQLQVDSKPILGFKSMFSEL